MSSRVLVTGAAGFVGRHVCKDLLGRGFLVRACVRTPGGHDLPSGVEVVATGELSAGCSWENFLKDVDYVVHLAGRAHTFEKEGPAKLESFRKNNVQVTSELLLATAKAGVKRFVYMSSVKVNGESSETGYRESDTPRPEDAYGTSKMEAENIVQSIASQGSGMEFVIIRPPLVYGKGVKGNFAKLIRLIQSGLPLPFSSVRNRRSLIFVGNLADFVSHCLEHPKARNEVFLVSDGRPVSTPGLLHAIADAMKRQPIFLPFSPTLMRSLSRLVGKESEIEKLIGSLVVDSSKAENLLGWKPPFTMTESLKQTL